MKKRSTFRRRRGSARPDIRNWSGHQSAREDARRKLKLKGDAFPAANVGRSHPDFGTTMSEHMELQAGRAAEAAKQVRVYMPERRGAR